MIESTCQCGALVNIPESKVGTAAACETCGATLHLVSAEPLADGAGTGDFDAKLVITAGPARVGDQLFLGGVQDITLGKLPDRHIPLPGGNRVSRHHCTLTRVDFGPSRWELSDNKSTNGVVLNGHPILSQQLKDGDKIKIGEYELTFISTLDQVIAKSREKARQSHTGAICPSCGDLLAANAKICIKCGVDVKTGRSLVVSKGLDEDDLAMRADTWIRALSWLIPFGLFPIASEAFGTKKPLTTWAIFGLTLVASIAFFFAMNRTGEPSPAVLNMMHWSGNGSNSSPQLTSLQAEAEKQIKENQAKNERGGRNADEHLSDEEIHDLVASALQSRHRVPEGVGFRWYQFFTSALIHDTDSVMGFIYHLGGNMVFFLVFGMRVNELIGNWRMSIVYPLLAIGSGLADHLMSSGGYVASLGASGAVMGLAGMYFVFFPVQRVHMAIWLRGGMLTRWQCFYKVFTMRGFWLLVLWIGFNDILPVFLDASDGVAHWAHLGGFISGMLLALILLISRQAKAMGTDVLSILLGKRAWTLIGRPDSAFDPAA